MNKASCLSILSNAALIRNTVEIGKIIDQLKLGGAEINDENIAGISQQYWGMVFPLGMYTVCTFQLSKAINFEPLMIIPRFFVYIAIAAWLASFAGLFYTLLFNRKKN